MQQLSHVHSTNTLYLCVCAAAQLSLFYLSLIFYKGNVFVCCSRVDTVLGGQLCVCVSTGQLIELRLKCVAADKHTH